MGSVTGEILENADCPVLSVPDEAKFDGRLDNMAFTVSFSEEDQKALARINDFAQFFGAEVRVINVDLAHTEEITNRMAQFRDASNFAGAEGMHFEALEGTDVYRAVTNYLDKNNIDILGMVTISEHSWRNCSILVERKKCLTILISLC